MTKEQIDKYITINHRQIKNAIANIKFKRRNVTDWEVDELITLLYEHLLKHQTTLTEKNIESYIIQYVSQNIAWERSQINKIYYTNDKLSFVDSVRDNITNEDAEAEMDEKIQQEIEYQTQLAIGYEFRQGLQPHQRVLYDAIYVDGLDTIKKLNNRFNICRSYISKMRIQLNNEFKEFVEKKGY